MEMAFAKKCSNTAVECLTNMKKPFDFDTQVDRLNSDSMKWARYSGRDVIPLWVADMDFVAPPAVIAALQERIAHGVFGYGLPSQEVIDAVVGHCQRAYGWSVDPRWLVWLPGLVTGLNVAARAVGEPGQGLLTAVPVYPPFLSAAGNAAKSLTTVALKQHESGWEWDFAAVDNAFAKSAAAVWFLCHPHNPVGRAWTDVELAQIAALAEKHDVVVVSDEIHCDLLLSAQAVHKPLAMQSASMAARTITLMAPSKTFNVPGLGCSFAIISDATVRGRFRRAMDGIVPHVNLLGYVACEAAYSDESGWHAALLDYLRNNAALVRDAVAHMPGVSMTPVEATYLAWLDCSGLMARGVSDPQRFFEEAGVGLSAGKDFGVQGDALNNYSHFVRLNFGCPRNTLIEALDRMVKAVAAL
jgi:cystathionine beta-lyase